MDTIYIGVDFHARQQTICYLTTESGEIQLHELKHQDKKAVREFYGRFHGHVVVGLEASGYSPWFERLLRVAVRRNPRKRALISGFQSGMGISDTRN